VTADSPSWLEAVLSFQIRSTLPPRLPPPPRAWTWAREIDLGAELLPDGLPVSRRIPAMVRREVSRAISEHMRRIVLDPTDEASWSLFLLSVHLLLWPRRRGGLAGIQELRDRVRRFEAESGVS
jgi:AcrR family transcriptional regulator